MDQRDGTMQHTHYLKMDDDDVTWGSGRLMSLATWLISTELRDDCEEYK